MQPEKSMKDYYAGFLRSARPRIGLRYGYWTQFISAESRPRRRHRCNATNPRLDIAQERVTAMNVDFHIADAYALPDQLGRFDAAFAAFWFSHVPRSRISSFSRLICMRDWSLA